MKKFNPTYKRDGHSKRLSLKPLGFEDAIKLSFQIAFPVKTKSISKEQICLNRLKRLQIKINQAMSQNDLPALQSLKKEYEQLTTSPA